MRSFQGRVHRRAAASLPLSRPGDRIEREASQLTSRALSVLAPAGLPMPSSGPLAAVTRRAFEQAFHHDFSAVRVHAAEEETRAVNANAFALGSDIYLGQGGRNVRVLAHELSHVVQFDRGSAPPMLLRDVAVPELDANYIRQVTGPEADKAMQKFDAAVAEFETDLQKVPDSPEANDWKGALGQLKQLRAAGKVTCWETRRAFVPAAYDNKSGEIRLHLNQIQAIAKHMLLHEAIHALHASRYAKLAKQYGEAVAAGGTSNINKAVLFWKWKAWTEYWAYRRSKEFGNVGRKPENLMNPHKEAMDVKDVRHAISRVFELDPQHAPFDPSKYEPPALYKTPPAQGAATATKP